MSKASKLLLVVLAFMCCTSGCGFRKDDVKADGNTSPQGPQQTSTSISSLEIVPGDWIVQDVKKGNVRATIKKVKSEKLAHVRNQFRVPELTQVTVPEANGFGLYSVHGYKELEGFAYIHPKIYSNSGTGQGQVLGYKTGKKDPLGKDLVQISIPIALVNGLVTSIPTIGGPQSGVGAAVTVPSKYQIPDVTALKARIGGKDLATLPVCPKLFRLIFEEREYWAKSPFEHLSVCPINQFFRISFEAPVSEMRHILETAAVRDESVSLATSLSVAFDLPREVNELSFAADDFRIALVDALKSVPPSGKTLAGVTGYAIQDIEQAVLDSIFKLSHDSGFEPRLSSSILAASNAIIANYFGPPFSCSAGGTCRTLLKHHSQRVPIQVSWMETETIASSIETESITALGAVANSSEFIAKPARDQLELVRRPPYFRGRMIADIVKECTELMAANFVFVPETGLDQIAYFKEYCRTMAGNGIRNDSDPNESDGYYPLGTNTVVYPGAWLKLDIDDISEFTTAKTRILPDGRVQVESQVVDMIATDPNGKRTQCVEGNAVACLEYKTKQIPLRSSNGDQMFSNDPCKKGEEGCDCARQPSQDGKPGDEICTRKKMLFQDVMDYECKKEDELEYCPYWRNQEDIVDYEVEKECINVKVYEKTSFLCLGGCGGTFEIQCKEKSRKPVKAIRQRLNCIEDDQQGIVPREKTCRAPKYKCKRWSIACTRYSVNEVFHVIHEDPAPKWRPYAIQKGEYPSRFEEDIYLKFVSPTRTVSNCRLNRFAREFRGNSIYIKIPSETNDGIQPCDKPLWTEDNSQPLYLPKVYIKNAISLSERRMCGRTEYTFVTKELPMSDGDGLVPPRLAEKTEARVGPIRESCRADASFQVGSDLWFTEYPPIRFSGRVSVLGRVLESVVTQERK